MAPRAGTKGVTRKATKGSIKKSGAEKSAIKKSVTKEPKKNVENNDWEKPASKRKLDPSGTMTPPPAKKCKRGVESSGWKKPASNGNRYLSSGPVLRSNCIFFKLPLEIRFMVYSDLIKSGCMELFRSCQKIHREAAEIVYRDGICIVEEPQFMYAERPAFQRKSIPRKVQNVEIHIDLKYFVSDREEYEYIDYLGAHYPDLKDPAASRKNCWIYFALGDFSWDPLTEERLVMVLETLREFDNVFININKLVLRRDQYRRQNAIAEAKSRFRSLGKGLEPFCGPSTWQDNPDPLKRYWVFHPRQERQRE